MQIDHRKCVGCANCIPTCPMGAIYIDTKINRATVNLDECVECFTCYRGMSKEHLNPTVIRTIRGALKLLRIRFDPEPDVCPTDALTPEELTWPRIVRRAFSDPLVPHESTGVHGRGTEEVKTNDVTGRVGEGEAGFTIEFGRPGVGVRFRDIQQMTMALAPLPITFEKKNPVFSLMSDPATGAIREDILNEKVLSAIVELKTTLEHVPQVFRVVDEVAPTLDTIVSIGVATRCDAQGDNLLEPLLKREGYTFYRGKTNLGLGRRPAGASA
ncbi:MAG TPA: 4Fe-4S dicluster domain-containing protein [Candidatus Methylomirabilis sp.]|nr:4Fe-4S dicluster domain-containing protein [Candidatus Methylomirabilis sp.]